MDTKQSTVTNLHLEKIAGFSFPKPPILEQIEIVRVLAHRVASLDALSTEADRAVALLLERRAALISAAVTGKIDVRALES
jgi:type I restriction enzyme S subunit